jgi:multimeric flavodoxin WrbA
MKVLGIYGSPREGGNSDLLLAKALEGAQSAGAEVASVFARSLKMSGCRECGGCNKTGKCVVDDDMQGVYPLLEDADIIFLASPIFFYGVTAQAKALIDRCQASWSKMMLEKTPEERKTYNGGTGYLIAVGATKGENLFEGAQLTARYFFDALNMSYEGGIFFKKIEGKAAISNHPEALKQAVDLGRSAVVEKIK